GEDVQEYARATTWVPTSCEDEVIALLRELRQRSSEHRGDSRESFFEAEQNALVVKNAESYYRAMVRGGAESWNVRDRHMTETRELLQPRGHRAIGVVYHPEYEHFGNYVPTVLPRRYDAFLFLNETHALHPLHVPVREEGEVPETYPSGV